MRFIQTTENIIKKLEQGMLIASLAVIVGVNLTQIGLRLLQSLLRILESDMVLHVPSWPADLNRILVLWIAILGASLATRSNEHIKVDVFSQLLPKRIRRLVHFSIYCVGITISGLLVYFSIQFLHMEYELGETLVAIPLPLWIVQLIIPIGFTIIGLRFFLLLLEGLGLEVYARDPNAAQITKHPREERGENSC